MNLNLQQHWQWNALKPQHQSPWIQFRSGVHDRSYPPHDHDFHELVVILGGSAKHRTVDADEKIEKGTILLIPAGIWHAYADCQHLDILMWLLHPQFIPAQLNCLRDIRPWKDLGHAAPSKPIGRHASGFIPPKNDCLTEVCQIWHSMERFTAIAEIEDHAPRENLSSLNLFSQFLRLCHILGKYWDLPSTSPNPTHPAVKHCLNILDTRFSEALTIDELAASCGKINPSYLMRLFRAQTGKTIIDYLVDRRLETAANLLLISNNSITEVAFQCGFNDSAYFTRRFSRHFQKTPRAFRAAFSHPSATSNLRYGEILTVDGGWMAR